MSTNQPFEVNGWKIYTHPLFLNQFEKLLAQVERLCNKDPDNYQSKNATKRLAAVAKLAFEVIPQDPASKYRQGTTLGNENKHWFRAKFFQHYRLFFRYHLKNKIIVFAWVNDEDSKRAYESNKDAYRVFKKMLESGHPPNDWDLLLKEAEGETTRLKKAVKQKHKQVVKSNVV